MRYFGGDIRRRGDRQTATVMEKPRVGIGAKIFIAAILVVAAYLLVQQGREAARVGELASLSPCTLAAEYARWRLAFEEEHPASQRGGAAESEFVQQNELFEKAVGEALEGVDSAVLEALEDLTAVDSESWIREPGDIDAFVAVMLAECPAEVEGLMRDAER